MNIRPEQLSHGIEHILFDAACIKPPPMGFFEPDHWRRHNAVLSQAQGRGAACIFRYGEHDFVLRHYRRGGLMARLSDDRYQWSGLEKTRAWREWRLLADMYQQGLPVPRPVAARVRRHGLFYSADLVTLCLPGVTPLADVLMRHALPEPQWQRVGAVIKRFHAAGIFHADLNARNILLDPGGEVFLIDFDKGARRRPEPGWQQANLDRLLRSLKKFKTRQARFYFDDQDWDSVLLGYRA